MARRKGLAETLAPGLYRSYRKAKREMRPGRVAARVFNVREVKAGLRALWRRLFGVRMRMSAKQRRRQLAAMQREAELRARSARTRRG